MTTQSLLRVYLVDDESLALKRLTRLLRQTQRVEIVGCTVNPDEAISSGFRIRRSDFLDRHRHSSRLVGSGICRCTLDVGGALAAVADRNISTATNAAIGSF